MGDIVLVYCDGSCEPINPGGYACFGWLVEYRNKIIHADSGCIGSGAGMTNNRAEYEALIKSLEWLSRYQERIKGGHLEVVIRSDSQLVVNQVAGRWNINSDALLPLARRAQELVAQVGARMEWVPRTQNKKADALSRSAYLQVQREEKQRDEQRRCA